MAFTSIDPTQYSNLTFSVETQYSTRGTNVTSYFAVQVGGAEIHLTPIEYKLVTTLAKHAGMVMTHRQLLEQVWGPGHAHQMQYLRVYMTQLRHKLEKNPARPRYLLTEPGVGYRIKES